MSKKSQKTKPAGARTLYFRLAGPAADMGAGDAIDKIADETGSDVSDILRACVLLGLAQVVRDRSALVRAVPAAREALAA